MAESNKHDLIKIFAFYLAPESIRDKVKKTDESFDIFVKQVRRSWNSRQEEFPETFPVNFDKTQKTYQRKQKTNFHNGNNNQHINKNYNNSKNVTNPYENRQNGNFKQSYNNNNNFNFNHAFPYASPIKNMDMMHVAVTMQIDANGLNLLTHLELRKTPSYPRINKRS